MVISGITAGLIVQTDCIYFGSSACQEKLRLRLAG